MVLEDEVWLEDINRTELWGQILAIAMCAAGDIAWRWNSWFGLLRQIKQYEGWGLLYFT